MRATHYETSNDTEEMIQRCLSCTYPVCRGEASCAAGKAQNTSRAKGERKVDRVARLVKEGYSRAAIAEAMNVSRSGLSKYIYYAYQCGLLTDDELQASKTKGGRNGVHPEEASTDR